MKIRGITGTGSRRSRGRQGGFAVLVVLALLTLVLIFVGANLRTLDILKRELKLVERQQIRRLNSSQTTTNAGALFPPANTNAPPVAGAR
jgi:hypothetical protein